MGNFIKAIPTLYTTQLKETISFYCDKLGFECTGYEEADGWVNVKKGEVELMFTLPNEHLPFDKPNFTGSIYVKVDGIEALWNDLKDQIEIAYPLETFDYGIKEFAIKDNNGYLIQFGEEMKDTLEKTPILLSTITCPECRHKKEEKMPTDACQFFYECEQCKTILKPKQGDCCVFCSYGTVACPPIQEGGSCGDACGCS